MYALFPLLPSVFFIPPAYFLPLSNFPHCLSPRLPIPLLFSLNVSGGQFTVGVRALTLTLNRLSPSAVKVRARLQAGGIIL